MFTLTEASLLRKEVGNEITKSPAYYSQNTLKFLLISVYFFFLILDMNLMRLLDWFLKPQQKQKIRRR